VSAGNRESHFPTELGVPPVKFVNLVQRFNHPHRDSGHLLGLAGNSRPSREAFSLPPIIVVRIGVEKDVAFRMRARGWATTPISVEVAHYAMIVIVIMSIVVWLECTVLDTARAVHRRHHCCIIFGVVFCQDQSPRPVFVCKSQRPTFTVSMNHPSQHDVSANNVGVC